MTYLGGRGDSREIAPELERLVTVDGPDAIRVVFPSAGAVVGRAGIDVAADVPWIAVFPPGSTSAQAGSYLVYLFAKDGNSLQP